jgi:hypothetical protein
MSSPVEQKNAEIQGGRKGHPGEIRRHKKGCGSIQRVKSRYGRDNGD